MLLEPGDRSFAPWPGSGEGKGRRQQETVCYPKSVSSLMVILNEVKDLFFTIC
jgi:hypothetical protein